MPKTILVIDDCDKIQLLVRAILAGEAVNIHSATDPKYGMVLAASERPDLILLDVDMPGINGFNVCEMLKADPETAGCPIIFLTSISSPADKVQGLGLGANDYVTKPFNHAELLARVNASLRTTQVIKSLEEQAHIDPLTGLGNRRMLDRRLKAELDLRARTGNPLAMIELDVDEFKLVNARHGRAVGDQVLKAVASVLARTCPSEDVICRLGNGKFIVLAPATSKGEAHECAEKLKRGVSKIEIRVAPRSMMESDTLGVTCSIGIAYATEQYDRSVMRRVDEATIAAKRRGGNSLFIDSSFSQAA